MPTCPFCSKSVPTFKTGSHIVPEWMYLDIYDTKHRTSHIDVTKNTSKLIQKGLRDQFICSNCETEFAYDDDFGKKCLILKQKINASVVFNLGDIKVEHWTNVDFKKLQKFILSVIIRWYLAADPNEKRTLGSGKFDEIKKIYNDASKDDDSIPIIIYRPDADKNFIPVTFPFVGSNQSVKCCTFFGAGLAFQAVIESAGVIPRFFKEFRIKKNNSFYLFQIPLSRTQIASSVLSILSNLKKP